MKTLTRIIAQVHENYSDTSVPHWKPKMGQEFEVRIDLDLLMYCEEDVVEAIIEFLKGHSNDHQRFTYLSHAPIFQTPEVLCTADEFEAKVRELYEAKQPKETV